MPTEPPSDNWREEWLAEDAERHRESVGDIAKEAARFAGWKLKWELATLLGLVVLIAIAVGLITLFR